MRQSRDTAFKTRNWLAAFTIPRKITETQGNVGKKGEFSQFFSQVLKKSGKFSSNYHENMKRHA